MSDMVALRARLPRLSAHPFFRRMAAESLRRGDQARERGHLVPAARHYATAGVMFRFIGAVRPAAVAFLELGGIHLALGRLERLPGVVDSIRALRPPAAGLLFVRVSGEILANAVTNRLAFVELLEQLREQRQSGDPDFAAQPAAALEENPEMSDTEPPPAFALPLDELRRGLAGHPNWEVTDNGARLVRVIPLSDLRRPGSEPGHDLRPLHRGAAAVAQRMVRLGVPVSCSFDGSRVEIRVPATLLGLGFIAECDHAGLTGSSAAEGTSA